MEEAVELYMYAGAPRPALHLLNHQLSDLLEPALDDRVAGGQIRLCSIILYSPLLYSILLFYSPHQAAGLVCECCGDLLRSTGFCLLLLGDLVRPGQYTLSIASC